MSDAAFRHDVVAANRKLDIDLRAAPDLMRGDEDAGVVEWGSRSGVTLTTDTPIEDARICPIGGEWLGRKRP